MRFVLWKDTEDEETPVRLRLVTVGDHIALAAVSEFGEALPGGYLVGIYPNGTLQRFPNINPDLGFQLEFRGRIAELSEVKRGRYHDRL